MSHPHDRLQQKSLIGETAKKMKLSQAVILMVVTRISVINAACDATANSGNCLDGNGICENDICWCVANKGGTDCKESCSTACTAETHVCTAADTCTPCSGLGTCANGGTCGSSGNPTAGMGCRCAEGFAGADCSKVKCDDADNQCGNGGTCGTDGLCECDAGYTGDFCAENIDDCSPNPCLNGGVCTDGVNTYTCACADGYAGTDCDKVDCTKDPCAETGTCDANASPNVCNCDEGYTGLLCDVEDHCTPNPCQNEGNCTISGNGYSCDCEVGFTGANCESGAFRITTALPLMLAALFILKLIN